MRPSTRLRLNVLILTLNVNSFLADCMGRAWYMFTVQRGGGAGEIDAGGPEPRQRKRKFTGLFQVS